MWLGYLETGGSLPNSIVVVQVPIAIGSDAQQRLNRKYVVGK
jgi:hypothetical protein